MEYTINKLAKIANISTRTLRYYDEIGLLKPKRINSSGYRLYGKKEIDLLQQILFYKELGFELKTIKKIITSSTFDIIEALNTHKYKLIEKKKQINILLNNIDKTIAYHEGRINMKDKDKFHGFKQQLINENERHYGKEIRKKYGDKIIDQSNEKILNKNKIEFEEHQALTKELYALLKAAIKTGDPSSELAQKAAELHKKWLCYYWSNYNKDAHRNLAQMYVEDERFKKHYNDIHPGLAEFLKDTIYIYTNN